MTARMPQRFRWKIQNDGDWKYGVVLPGGTLWHIRAGHGHGSFMDDPWEIMGHIIGDIAEFEWIDNEFGWTGDMMPLVGGTDMIRLAEIRKQIHDRYVCWNEVTHEIAKDLLAEVDRLGFINNVLQSIASNGWVEAWHCGNGFMALEPGVDHLTVMRCWQESSTLKAIQRFNSR